MSYDEPPECEHEGDAGERNPARRCNRKGDEEQANETPRPADASWVRNQVSEVAATGEVPPCQQARGDENAGPEQEQMPPTPC